MSFEAKFFGPGNKLRWESITGHAAAAADTRRRLEPFLEDLRADRDVVFLPRASDKGSTEWYALCNSSRACRVALDEVRAFLGPTYAASSGREYALDPSDPIDKAVLERCGRNAFRFTVSNPALVSAARERLLLLSKLRKERPVRHGQRIRATGRIIREFEYALLTRDEATAAACIAELRSTGSLSAANMLFLEVRQRLVTGRPREMLAAPELDTLLSIRLPRRVTEALIAAVYETELRRFELDAEPAAAIAHFRTRILPRYGSLFLSRAGLDAAMVETSFMLLAAASQPPRPELAAAILDGLGRSSRSADYLRAIAALIPKSDPAPAPAEPLAAARDAFSAGDVDRALTLAQSLPRSTERTVLLLRCAAEIGTLAAAQVALHAYDELAETERARIDANPILSRLIATLRNTQPVAPAPIPTPQDVPASLSAWLRALQSPERWRGAVNVAERGVREWSRQTLLDDPDEAANVADLLLAELPEWGQIALRDAMPYLLEFVFTHDPDVRLSALYDSLFLVIAVDDQHSLPQLRGLLRVAEAKMALGMKASAYREAVDVLSQAIQALESPSSIDAALDTLVSLIESPCPLPTARQDFAGAISALCQRWFRHVDASQRVLLHSLSEELGIPLEDARLQPETTAEGGAWWDALKGKHLAMYSLHESALRRAARALTALCAGGVRIDCFHDKVGGSAALRTAAATADLFIIATAAAKHAATGFIEANRQQSKGKILYARGGGSASLLAAVREHLEVSR